MKKETIAMVWVLVFFIGASSLPAQDKPQEWPISPTLRHEVIKLRFVKAKEIQPLLYGFASPYGKIFWTENLPHVLTLNDLPSHVDKMLTAIKEIDIKPSDLLFTAQLILASESEEKTDSELQADPLIKELRRLLRYKSFTLMDSALIRAVDEESSTMIIGDAAQFKLEIQGNATSVKGQALAVIQTDIRLLQIKEKVTPLVTAKDVSPPVVWGSISRELLRSHLNLKSGERAVVGVSRLDGGEKGLILIVSGKVID